MKVNILSYTDYQAYLQDWYQNEKKLDRAFSYRSFSKKVGLKSSSFSQRVFTGESALPRKSIDLFSKAMNHTLDETEYLKLLVSFKHAKKDTEKHRCLRKIQATTDSDTIKLDIKRYEYFSTWYHPIIREIVTAIDFDKDYLKLGRILQPQISAKQAHESVKLLIELGLIERQGHKYQSLQNTIIAKEDTDKLALRNYQKAFIDLGRDSMDRFPKEERNVFTISAGVSEKTAEDINRLVIEFQKKILTCLNRVQTIEVTRQINVQIFPVSTKLTSQGGSK